MQLRYWFILFLSTGLITTACKTSQLTNKNSKNNQNDTTKNSIDSNQTFVPDSIILRDTSAFNTNGDSTKLVPKKSPLDAKVDYHAQDSIVFDATGKVLFLYDTAQINYQEIELKANYIEINMDKKELWEKAL